MNENIINLQEIGDAFVFIFITKTTFFKITNNFYRKCLNPFLFGVPLISG